MDPTSRRLFIMTASAPTTTPDHIIIAKETPGTGQTTAAAEISNDGFLYGRATKTTVAAGRYLSINGTQYTNNSQFIQLEMWNLSGGSGTYSFRSTWTSTLGLGVPVATTGTGTCTPVQAVNSGNWTDLACSRIVTLSSTADDNDGLLTLDFALNTNLSSIVKTVTIKLAALSAG